MGQPHDAAGVAEAVHAGQFGVQVQLHSLDRGGVLPLFALYEQHIVGVHDVVMLVLIIGAVAAHDDRGTLADALPLGAVLAFLRADLEVDGAGVVGDGHGVDLAIVALDLGKEHTLDKTTESLLYSDYRRHHADQLASVLFAIRQAAEKFPDTKARIILTGSGAKPVAEAADTPYIQEVVANSIALKKTYETVGTAIELGGQDAKIIFFKTDSKTGALNVADMRMNGSCAGGTGAFIDEVASILQTPPEKMNELACKGTCVYDISGRCGVYAKTDIQPLLNQGVAKADIALSSFHAIAKQTIGGLAQGLDIKPPVVFEGGPLTFNPKLIDVFSERLNLKGNERLVPEHPEIMVAYGAALSLNGIFKEADPEASDAPVTFLPLTEWVSRLEQVQEDAKKKQHSGQEHAAPLFFSSKEEHDTFLKEHPKGDFTPAALTPGTTVRAWLGIDSGSTTTKFVLMGDDGKLLDFFYASNQGDPLTVAKNALITMLPSSSYIFA